MAVVRVGLGADVGIGSSGSDGVVTNTSTANVLGQSDPIISDTVSIHGKWPGAALTVTWQSLLIRADHVVHVTLVDTTRVRIGVSTVATPGEVVITRSGGAVVDEEFHATLAGAPP